MRDISFDHQIHSLRADLLRTEYAFLLLQQAMLLKHRHHHKADSDETATSHYVWVTAGDDKVRPSHADNEGQIFSWDDPPATGHPGEDSNCRCSAEPYDQPPSYPDAIEPVYPELAILPLLRGGKLFAAWQALALQGSTSRSWRLGSHKTSEKWTNRMNKGDWTPDKITRTIKYGKPYKAPNRVNKSNTATRYERDGNFVVVDDMTKEVLQLGEPHYAPDKLP